MLLLAQLAWTLTVVNLMQLKTYCTLIRERTKQQTGTLDHRRGANILFHNLMKPSLLRRHLETKHANLKNKPQEFFERELRRLSRSKTGKPHTIVEDLILPAAADMAGTMLGEKAKKTIQTMPSSNNTVSRRISDMAGDVLNQLLLHIQASEFYALQLDESTGLAQLLVN
jgi:hypothetical protein